MFEPERGSVWMKDKLGEHILAESCPDKWEVLPGRDNDQMDQNVLCGDLTDKIRISTCWPNSRPNETNICPDNNEYSRVAKQLERFWHKPRSDELYYPSGRRWTFAKSLAINRDIRWKQFSHNLSSFSHFDTERLSK